MRPCTTALMATVILLLAACSAEVTKADPSQEILSGDGLAATLDGGSSEPVDTYVAEPGEFGWPCTGQEDCYSGWCVPSPEGNICTKTCLDSCPPGWSCRPLVKGDITYLCLPRWTHLCDPCSNSSDCSDSDSDSGHYCLDWGGEGRFCGGECASDGVCPTGYHCKDVPVGDGVTNKQCVPESGTCECSNLAQELGLSTVCSVSGPAGVCQGKRSCSPNGLSSCNAPTPSLELCDGLDNDCNGATDDLPPNYDCQKANEFGVCSGKGSCIGGLEMCDAATPSAELCDGLDNDCDSEIDEDSADSDGDGQSDCIDEDDDNDGIPDVEDNCIVNPNPDQLNTDGDLQGDVCDDDDDNDSSPDVDDCEPLNAQVKPGAIELCDGIDNNCNGQTDENLCDDGNPCTDDACQADGNCAHSNNQVPCDDGSVCTSEDKCLEGSCQGFSPIDCSDGDDCTADGCDPVAGCTQSTLSGPTCVNDPDGCHSCEDGSPCTSQDYCLKGTCKSGPITDCTDGNPCVFAQCNPQTGCMPPQPISNNCFIEDIPSCHTAKCVSGQCLPMPTSGQSCTTNSSKCKLGTCTGDGSCLPNGGQPCQTSIGLDLCQSVDVTGICDSAGNCNVGQAPPGYTCPGCNGICIQCFILQFCIPFSDIF